MPTETQAGAPTMEGGQKLAPTNAGATRAHHRLKPAAAGAYPSSKFTCRNHQRDSLGARQLKHPTVRWRQHVEPIGHHERGGLGSLGGLDCLDCADAWID